MNGAETVLSSIDLDVPDIRGANLFERKFHSKSNGTVKTIVDDGIFQCAVWV